MPESRGRVMAGFTLLLGLVMIAGGLAKLVGEPHQVAGFAAWGLPGWFRLLVGTFEVLGGLLLLIPGSTPIGALVLSTIMVGAVWTHFANGEWLHSIPPGVLLTLFVLIFKRNVPQAIRLLEGR